LVNDEGMAALDAFIKTSVKADFERRLQSSQVKPLPAQLAKWQLDPLWMFLISSA
jgi:hypothetical protein